MKRNVIAVWAAVLMALVAVTGCSSPNGKTPSKDEDDLKQAFASLQEALKAKDADKVWALLDADSQADAEREAKAVREAYAKADKAGKEELEKSLGLSGKELEALKGVGFLKTRRFLGKYDEIDTSKFDKASTSGARGTVNYTETDGDKEKLSFVKENGGWKVSLPMPSAK